VSAVDLDRPSPASADVLLINRGGMLADLYRLGKVAFVGGGFGKGVHSVIEPMANGLPVLCGPNIHVSHEAGLAATKNLLAVVDGRNQAATILSSWLADNDVNEKRSREAREFVKERAGASKIIVETILRNLNGNA
jgi:3-deoxy-D-manno-octulosonic-acid transferase